jgi:hypothetical protein
MRAETCQKVLKRAFNMSFSESRMLMAKNSYNGFQIVCRPSQFARFIVYRFDTDECINGIKDLAPELFTPTTVYDDVAGVINLRGRDFSSDLSGEEVREIVLLFEKLAKSRDLDDIESVDVSGRAHDERPRR